MHFPSLWQLETLGFKALQSYSISFQLEKRLRLHLEIGLEVCLLDALLAASNVLALRGVPKGELRSRRPRNASKLAPQAVF